MNSIDKIRSIFNPEFAYKASLYRNAARIINGGSSIYDGATSGPHYRVALETSVDEDLEDLVDLRATSRDKYKNNGFFTGIIKCATDHVVGSGLQCKASINRRKIKLSEKRIIEIENQLTDYFDDWADSKVSDATAKDNFYVLQRLAYITYKVDGDLFATLPLTKIDEDKQVLQVDLIGSENIVSNSPDFIQGIKLSDLKIPILYSILQTNGTFKEVKAYSNNKRNIIHLFERERIKQVRGVPFLSAVIRDIDYIHQYMNYELTAAKLSAIFFGSITTQSSDSVFGDGLDLLSGKSGKQAQTAQNTVKENSITQLMPGDKLDINRSGRDNPNYDKFIKTSLQKVSAKTRIPLEIILAQFVSSYSASRAAMLQMTKFVKPERELFINSFCKPIRNQVLTWGILSGDLDIPEFLEYGDDLFDCVWMGEPMGSVDPQKDIKAKILAIDNNLSTYEQATLELGYGNFETNINILEKEISLLEKLIELRNKVKAKDSDN